MSINRNRRKVADQQQEVMSLDAVAQILAEQCGGECACDFFGNDQWLPRECRYAADDCPNPPEHLGGWKEFIRCKQGESKENML